MDSSATASIIQESWPHTLNVAVHVLVGTVALALGVVQLVRTKGDATHLRYGQLFLACIWVSVATATIGVVVYRFRAFFGVITLLVAYWAFSGVRALRIRSTGPTALDAMASVLAFAAAGGFLAFLRTVQFPWDPSVIYSTLGTLLTVATYDLLRFTFPTSWFRSLGVYEHLVKMVGAFSAALSAFSGTVLGAWQPYSQVLPSAFCTVLAVALVVYYGRTSLPEVVSPHRKPDGKGVVAS